MDMGFLEWFTMGYTAFFAVLAIRYLSGLARVDPPPAKDLVALVFSGCPASVEM